MKLRKIGEREGFLYVILSYSIVWNVPPVNSPCTPTLPPMSPSTLTRFKHSSQTQVPCLPIERPTRARSIGLQLMMCRPSPMLQSYLVDETAAFPKWALSMPLNRFLEGHDPAIISNRHRSLLPIVDSNERFAQFVAVSFGAVVAAPRM